MTPSWSLHLLLHLGVAFAIFRVSLGQSCTFQSGLCGWISVGAGPRWRSSRDPNTSSSSSEELALYAYVTLSQNTSDNGTATLQSPEVTAATTDTVEITFQYQLSDHRQGEQSNALSLRWSKNGGDFDDVWHTSGPTDSWVTTSLMLAQGGVSKFTVQYVAEINAPSQDAFVRVRNAEIKLKRDSCASAPCLHGGLCFGNGPTFTCICTGGYRGEICQILPGIPLSRFFLGRTSRRGVTTIGPENGGTNINSMATLTSTDIPTASVQISSTSGQRTNLATRGTVESSTRATGTMKATTNPTSPRSTINSSPSPCLRRSTVPTVTAATTEASAVTDAITDTRTPTEETTSTSASRETYQSEPQDSTSMTTQILSTLARSTEAVSNPLSSTVSESKSSDSPTLTSTTPSVNDPTTTLEDLSPIATNVVSDILTTGELSATSNSFTSAKVKSPSPTTMDYLSTLPDETTASSDPTDMTESVRTTQDGTLVSFGTEITTLDVSQRSTTTDSVTQSLTTKEALRTNSATTITSTDDVVITTETSLLTTESSTASETSAYYLISTELQTSKTTDLLTQSSATKEELSINTDYASTSSNGIVITETVTTGKLSTEERTAILETSISTKTSDLTTAFRPSSATTENHEFDTSDTPTTPQPFSSTGSSEDMTSSTTSTKSTESSISDVITEGSTTDLPTTGIGVQSTTSSKSASSSSSSSSSSPAWSSTNTLKVTSDLLNSREATTTINTLLTTNNDSTSSTEVIGSSQSSFNSSSPPVPESDGGVNVPLTVGLSVTSAAVLGVGVAGTVIFIIRRARRVSYGVAQ